MRVELIYAPGCNSYRNARNTLETVIADEGLPIPVELIEEVDQVGGSPTIRIDGHIVASSAKSHHIDSLRELVCRKWKELTEGPLLRTT
jgi:hypothetical protein